jgi:hypothetical protein
MVGEKEDRDPRYNMVNGWGDIALIFSWEATYAGCRGLELKVGSQLAVIVSNKIPKIKKIISRRETK